MFVYVLLGYVADNVMNKITVTNSTNISTEQILFTFLVYIFFINYSLRLLKMPVWDWTICTSKCLELYRENK